MAPAHLSVDLRPLPGVAPAAAPSPAVAAGAAKPSDAAAAAVGAQRPAVLNRRSLDALSTIETLLKSVPAQPPASPRPAGPSAALEPGAAAPAAPRTAVP
jgi:hypothetical protein